MIRPYSILGVVFISLFTLTCTSQHNQVPTDQEIKQAIQANFQEMDAAMQDRNTAKLASYFTEDACFKFPGQAPVKGREAVQKVPEGMISQGLGYVPLPIRSRDWGNHAFELGTVDILGHDGSVVNKAYYLTLWKTLAASGKYTVTW